MHSSHSQTDFDDAYPTLIARGENPRRKPVSSADPSSLTRVASRAAIVCSSILNVYFMGLIASYVAAPPYPCVLQDTGAVIFSFVEIISLTKSQLTDTVSTEYTSIEAFVSVGYIAGAIVLALVLISLAVFLALYVSHRVAVFAAAHECHSYCF